MTDRQELILGLMTFLKVGLFAPLLIGILMNIDGIGILINQNQYKSGTVIVDSVNTRLLGEDNASEFFALGYADTVYTSVPLGQIGNGFTEIIVSELGEGKNPQIPVWYRSDGYLTLRRYEEQHFPTWRISKKIVLFAFGFMGPFIFLFILQKRLKKKWKKQ